MRSPDQIEGALQKAAQRNGDLSPEERAAIREVLDWWRSWKALGRLGKAVLWLIITAGAIAAAARELRGSGWFGG